jgi:hypothetical protein
MIGAVNLSTNEKDIIEIDSEFSSQVLELFQNDFARIA